MAKVLQRGTWGDDITLQVFCDSTGYGLKVYCIGVDVDAEDLALRHHMKTPYYDENPHIILEICNIQVRVKKGVKSLLDIIPFGQIFVFCRFTKFVKALLDKSMT